MQLQRVFSAEKIENYIGKKNDISNMFAQNIDCGYTLGGSNEYPQSMFWIKNKKGQLFYIKVGFKGEYISRTCFPDEI